MYMWSLCRAAVEVQGPCSSKTLLIYFSLIVQAIELLSYLLIIVSP